GRRPMHAFKILTASAIVLCTAAFATKPSINKPPATSTATATAPAASQARDPKAALSMFFDSMHAADKAALMKQLYLANDDARTEAEAVLGQAVGEMEFRKGLAATYHDDAGTATLPDLDSLTRQQMQKELDAAKISVDGDTAKVAMGPGPAI